MRPVRRGTEPGQFLTIPKPAFCATIASESEDISMSQVKPIPDGYHTIQPYLVFKNCAEAIAFYTKAFGAREKFRMPDARGRIGHAEIEIGDSTIMMADEAPQVDAFSVEHFGGSPISLLIYTKNCDAMYGQALAAGAKSLREPADQPLWRSDVRREGSLRLQVVDCDTYQERVVRRDGGTTLKAL
jgi:PhnB protein